MVFVDRWLPNTLLSTRISRSWGLLLHQHAWQLQATPSAAASHNPAPACCLRPCRVWHQALGQPCAVQGTGHQGQQPILTLHRSQGAALLKHSMHVCASSKAVCVRACSQQPATCVRQQGHKPKGRHCFHLRCGAEQVTACDKACASKLLAQRVNGFELHVWPLSEGASC